MFKYVPHIDIYAIKLLRKYAFFLLYMYYTCRGYRTSICGKNCAYYIQMFMAYATTLQCCAAAFIENLNAESLSIRAEDFDRYMSGAATPHDPSQVTSDILVITTETKMSPVTKTFQLFIHF